MKVTTSIVGNVMVARLAGEIDTVDSDDFSGALSSLLAAKPARLVLDFSEVSYIASVGLSLLLKLAQEMRAMGGKVAIAAATPAVSRVLETVHLGSVVPIKPTVESAMGYMGATVVGARS